MQANGVTDEQIRACVVAAEAEYDIEPLKKRVDVVIWGVVLSRYWSSLCI